MIRINSNKGAGNGAGAGPSNWLNPAANKGSVFPSSPANGDRFLYNTDNCTYVYNSGTWTVSDNFSTVPLGTGIIIDNPTPTGYVKTLTNWVPIVPSTNFGIYTVGSETELIAAINALNVIGCGYIFIKSTITLTTNHSIDLSGITIFGFSNVIAFNGYALTITSLVCDLKNINLTGNTASPHFYTSTLLKFVNPGSLSSDYEFYNVKFIDCIGTDCGTVPVIDCTGKIGSTHLTFEQGLNITGIGLDISSLYLSVKTLYSISQCTITAKKQLISPSSSVNNAYGLIGSVNGNSQFVTDGTAKYSGISITLTNAIQIDTPFITYLPALSDTNSNVNDLFLLYSANQNKLVNFSLSNLTDYLTNFISITAGANTSLSNLTTTAINLPLNLVTGTATHAPLYFSGGILLTTPVNGAMEFDGSHLYFTIGGTRWSIDHQVTTSYANSSLTNLSNVDINTSLNLVAGSTTAAPLYFKTGSLLTTATAGALEYDGTHIYITNHLTERIQLDNLYIYGDYNDSSMYFAKNIFLSNYEDSYAFFNSSSSGTYISDASKFTKTGIGWKDPSNSNQPTSATISHDISTLSDIGLYYPALIDFHFSANNYTDFVTNRTLITITNLFSTIFQISANGNFGFGTYEPPTAYIHIKAGTNAAGTAPLKLTAGTNLDTPEDGTLQYDGTHLYFTIGSTVNQIDGAAYTISTGLTNNSDTLTVDISTGISGGQTIYGGINDAESLFISSTASTLKGFIYLGQAGNSMYDEFNDLLGIGVTPTAALHIKAGSNTPGTAALKLSVGASLDTPEDGVFEYDGTHLYFTIGSTRNTLI